MFTRSLRVLTAALAIAACLAGGTLPSTQAATSAQSATVPIADAHVETVFDRPAAHLTAFDGRPYFTARDAVHGWEIWRSDGTPQGNRLLKDVKRGTASSYPTGLTATRDLLFFFARGQRGKTDLWRSDGTRSGTTVVKRNLVIDTYDVESIGVGRLLYFFAFDADGRLALWRSDGTRRGTVVLRRNTWPGWERPAFSNDDRYDEMVKVGNRLFFAADGDRKGVELWTSNGTARGTRLVKDIFVSSRPDRGSAPSSLTAVGKTLFFAAEDRTHGRELWKSDGTSAGTSMVADFTSDPFRDPGPGELTAVGQTLFLTNDRYYPTQLWKSDGTRAGTVLVSDADAGDLAVAGGTLFFRAPVGGLYEVWMSDGTSAGTTELTNLHEECVTPGACRRPSKLTAIGDSLYFAVVATDENHNYQAYELWITDGTSAGTGRIEAFAAPGSNAEPPFDSPINVDGVPYLVGNDSNGSAQRILKVVKGS